MSRRAGNSPDRRVVRFCRWAGCRETISAGYYCCRAHWFALPAQLREEINRSRIAGQPPSAEYIAAHQAVQEWIKTKAPTREAPKPFNETKDSEA